MKKWKLEWRRNTKKRCTDIFEYAILFYILELNCAHILQCTSGLVSINSWYKRTDTMLWSIKTAFLCASLFNGFSVYKICCERAAHKEKTNINNVYKSKKKKKRWKTLNLWTREFFLSGLHRQSVVVDFPRSTYFLSKHDV